MAVVLHSVTHTWGHPRPRMLPSAVPAAPRCLPHRCRGISGTIPEVPDHLRRRGRGGTRGMREPSGGLGIPPPGPWPTPAPAPPAAPCRPIADARPERRRRASHPHRTRVTRSLRVGTTPRRRTDDKQKGHVHRAAGSLHARLDGPGGSTENQRTVRMVASRTKIAATGTRTQPEKRNSAG